MIHEIGHCLGLATGHYNGKWYVRKITQFAQDTKAGTSHELLVWTRERWPQLQQQGALGAHDVRHRGRQRLYGANAATVTRTTYGFIQHRA